MRKLKPYSFAWITLILFLGSLLAHLSLALHNGDDFATWLQEVAENWQSEFLQLLWQVCGLAWFLYIGSPSSKESSQRLEAKVDYLMDKVSGGPQRRVYLDQYYARKE